MVKAVERIAPVSEKFIYTGHDIVFFGGGRWARILIQAALSFLPEKVNIKVCSPRSAQYMRNWVLEQNIEKRVNVFEEIDECLAKNISFVVVVNAVNDHQKAIRWSLNNDIPVLVEKPLSLNYKNVSELASIAVQKHLLFAPAHIFLFADYLQNFAQIIKSRGGLMQIEIHWMDPSSEKRYGENKTYDSSVPVFADLMPHILSVLWVILPEVSFSLGSLNIERGGSTVNILLKSNKVDCKVILARNWRYRQRLIKVVTTDGISKLDFSKEPGIITFNNIEESADAQWSLKEKPSVLMLKAFLSSIEEKKTNTKLDIKLGLKACELIEQMLSVYQKSQSAWLLEKLNSQSIIDNDIKYAWREILNIQSNNSYTESWQVCESKNA